jgi:hypothetical protein
MPADANLPYIQVLSCRFNVRFHIEHQTGPADSRSDFRRIFSNPAGQCYRVCAPDTGKISIDIVLCPPAEYFNGEAHAPVFMLTLLLCKKRMSLVSPRCPAVQTAY